MNKILLGVSGSIAAYKAADIANNLSAQKNDVFVVMTRAAIKFIAPLTFQTLTRNRVITDVFQEDEPSRIAHIDLPQSCDFFLIAPATANIMAKICSGIADDTLSTMALATSCANRFIAPAMNTMMFQNPVTQKNIETLKILGWKIIPPRTSRLACGTMGQGAMAKVDDIIERIERADRRVI